MMNQNKFRKAVKKSMLVKRLQKQLLTNIIRSSNNKVNDNEDVKKKQNQELFFKEFDDAYVLLSKTDQNYSIRYSNNMMFMKLTQSLFNSKYNILFYNRIYVKFNQLWRYNNLHISNNTIINSYAKLDALLFHNSINNSISFCLFNLFAKQSSLKKNAMGINDLKMSYLMLFYFIQPVNEEFNLSYLNEVVWVDKRGFELIYTRFRLLLSDINENLFANEEELRNFIFANLSVSFEEYYKTLDKEEKEKVINMIRKQGKSMIYKKKIKLLDVIDILIGSILCFILLKLNIKNKNFKMSNIKRFIINQLNCNADQKKLSKSFEMFIKSNGNNEFDNEIDVLKYFISIHIKTIVPKPSFYIFSKQSEFPAVNDVILLVDTNDDGKNINNIYEPMIFNCDKGGGGDKKIVQLSADCFVPCLKETPRPSILFILIKKIDRECRIIRSIDVIRGRYQQSKDLTIWVKDKIMNKMIEFSESKKEDAATIKLEMYENLFTKTFRGKNIIKSNLHFRSFFKRSPIKNIKYPIKFHYTQCGAIEFAMNKA